MVQVGEPERPYEPLHAAGARPVLHGLEEGSAHLHVVDEVHEAEARVVPLAVGVHLMVYYPGYAPCGPAVAEGHEIRRLAEVEGGIVLGAESAHVVAHERRHVIRVSGIEVHLELGELPEVGLGGVELYCFNHFFLGIWGCGTSLPFIFRTRARAGASP